MKVGDDFVPQVGLVAINVIGDTVAKKKGGGVSDATNPVSIFNFLLLVLLWH